MFVSQASPGVSPASPGGESPGQREFLWDQEFNPALTPSQESADSQEIQQLSTLAGCSHSWKYPHVLRQLWTVLLKEKLQCPEREKYCHTPKVQVGIAQDVTTLLASPIL